MATRSKVQVPFVALLLTLAGTSNVVSQEYFVTNGNDAGNGSLRKAITDANLLSTSNSTIKITFSPGMNVNLASFLSPLNPGKNGQTGANTNRLIIDGNGSTINGSTDSSSGFQVFFAYSGTFEINNLTIANAKARGGDGSGGGGGGAGLGGGIFVNDLARVTATDITFHNTQAVGGDGGSSGNLGGGGGGMGGDGGLSVAGGGGGLYGDGGERSGNVGTGGGGGGGIGARGGDGGTNTTVPQDGQDGIYTSGTQAAGGNGIDAGNGGLDGGGGGGGGPAAPAGGRGGGGGVGASGQDGGVGGGGGGNLSSDAGDGGEFGGGGAAQFTSPIYDGGDGGFGGGGGSGGSGGDGGFGGGGGASRIGTAGRGGFGAGNGQTNLGSGGGGLGAGGAAFVREGGTLHLINPVFSGTVSAAGGSNGGDGIGQGLFLGGDTKVTVTNSNTLTMGGNDFLGGAGDDNSATAQGKLVKAGTGTLRLTGANSMDGGVLIEAGRVIADHNQALGTDVSYTQNINEVLDGGTLEIAAGRNLSNVQATVRAGGMLAINGRYDPSKLVLDNGATIGGNGSFANDVLTIRDGVHLAPGDEGTGTFTFDSASSLTLSSGSLLDFELGTDSDLLRVLRGNLVGTSTGLITVNISDIGGLRVQDYTLIDWTGANTNGLDLDDFVLGAGSPDGTLKFGNNSLIFASNVPEPATLVMFGIAAAFLLGVGIKRRRATQ